MDNNLWKITILLSVFITVILVYFFVSIVRYHRRYVKLQREHIKAEITIQENERKRIANDLHDSIGPMLSAVKMNINCIETISADDEQVITKSGRYIDEIITNLRRISYNLLPNSLERSGLAEALTEYVQNIQIRNSLAIQLKIINNLTVPAGDAIHIFRILQEIIHNTTKHAKASVLYIELEVNDEYLQITTRDDGVGFNSDIARKQSSGLGLKSIRSRVEMLGGELTLDSAPNKGTIYLLKIPV